MALPHKPPLLFTSVIARPGTWTTLYRCYATESAGDPYRWPRHKHPTPYDILETPRKGTYNKARYVEIVKLYHPDLSHIHTGSPSSNAACNSSFTPPPDPTVCLERFRLAVAANMLLSDASKRAAYDRFGIGWAHGPHYDSPAVAPHNWWGNVNWGAREGHEGYSPFRNAYGNGGPNDTSQNATWEDWERWRAQNPQYSGAAGGQQREVFAKNGTFMAVVLLLACVGGAAEVGYANKIGEEMVASTDKVTRELGRDVARRRKEIGDKEERIRKFLVMRDPVGASKMTGWEKKNVGGVDKRLEAPKPEDMKVVRRDVD